MNRPAEQRRYESPELPARPFLGLAAGFVALVAMLAALAIGLGEAVWPAPPEPPDVRQRTAVPGPDLQPAPETDLDRVRNRARTRLESYGWVDRERGIAHIPIERAMDLMVQREAEEGRP